MAAITSAMVKELRERTSAGMMDCKKALVESDGDMDKAIEWLREKGLSQAAKKASRIAAEGVVAQYTNDEGTIGAIVEVNCETDFVAKTDNFIGFANKVAKQVALANPADVDALMAQAFVDDSSRPFPTWSAMRPLRSVRRFPSAASAATRPPVWFPLTFTWVARSALWSKLPLMLPAVPAKR